MGDPMSLAEAKQIYPPMWVIYDKPKDHPTRFVVRVWYGMVACDACYLRTSLKQARELVAMEGASCNLGREELDDPCIVETWV